MKKLQKSSFSTEWEGPLESVKVELETPDFTMLSPEVEGDWGPNYKFQLNAADPFKINYTTKSSFKSVSLNLNEVTLLAPISFDQRKKYPLYFKFKDQSTNLVFKTYFNQDGVIAKLDVGMDQSKAISSEGAISCYAS